MKKQILAWAIVLIVAPSIVAAHSDDPNEPDCHRCLEDNCEELYGIPTGWYHCDSEINIETTAEVTTEPTTTTVPTSTATEPKPTAPIPYPSESSPVEPEPSQDETVTTEPRIVTDSSSELTKPIIISALSLVTSVTLGYGLYQIIKRL